MQYGDEITAAPVTVYKNSSTFKATRQQPPRPSASQSAEGLRVIMSLLFLYFPWMSDEI